jgi:hypothetical protein
MRDEETDAEPGAGSGDDVVFARVERGGGGVGEERGEVGGELALRVESEKAVAGGFEVVEENGALGRKEGGREGGFAQSALVSGRIVGDDDRLTISRNRTL